jgi:hypothetical protein
MTYNGRFGLEKKTYETPLPHIAEEPKKLQTGELSFLEYGLYLDFREEVSKYSEEPIGKKFPRENPRVEHFEAIKKEFDNLI